MLVLVLASLFTSPAIADDCDSKALSQALDEATPISSAKAYLKLAECDGAAAKKKSAGAFEKILSGADANEAARVAIKLEQEGVVRTWLANLEPDERGRTIAYLGKACKDEEALQGFFSRAHNELGEQFWQERWHKGLSDCRADSIQEMLTKAVADEALQKDQTRFFTVLEVYARNLGNKAIPTISALAQGTKDPETLMNLVNVLGDAANVGGSEGVNPAAAKTATDVLVQLGPSLPPLAVKQARKTLLAIGSQEEADQFASHRWRDRKDNGNYRYAVTVTESATCKNGKTFANMHFATFSEGGHFWPEQIEAEIQEKLVFEWQISGAEKCKGEGKIEVEMPNEPFASKEDAEKWIQGQKKGFSAQEASFDKTKTIGHESFSY